jgi:hypothetical protein
VGIQVYLGADPVSGEQRYATKTVRAGKREAQRVLNEMKVEAERRRRPDAAPDADPDADT